MGPKGYKVCAKRKKLIDYLLYLQGSRGPSGIKGDKGIIGFQGPQVHSALYIFNPIDFIRVVNSTGVVFDKV